MASRNHDCSYFLYIVPIFLFQISSQPAGVSFWIEVQVLNIHWTPMLHPPPEMTAYAPQLRNTGPPSPVGRSWVSRRNAFETRQDQGREGKRWAERVMRFSRNSEKIVQLTCSANRGWFRVMNRHKWDAQLEDLCMSKGPNQNDKPLTPVEGQVTWWTGPAPGLNNPSPTAEP